MQEIPPIRFRDPHNKSWCFRANLISKWGRTWTRSDQEGKLGLVELFRQFTNLANLDGPIDAQTFQATHAEIVGRAGKLARLTSEITGDQKSSESGVTGSRLGNITALGVTAISFAPITGAAIFVLVRWSQGDDISPEVVGILTLLQGVAQMAPPIIWQQSTYNTQRTGSLETITKEQQLPAANAVASFSNEVNRFCLTLPNPDANSAGHTLTKLDQLYSAMPIEFRREIAYYHLKQRLICALADGHPLKVALHTFVQHALAKKEIDKDQDQDYAAALSQRNDALVALTRRVGYLNVISLGVNQVFRHSKHADHLGNCEPCLVPLQDIEHNGNPPLVEQPIHHWWHHLPFLRRASAPLV